MSYVKDPRVDAYLDALPDWQQAICRRVRDLVHAADPEVEETIKRTVQPYFVLDGNICALLAAKDHVNVFLYDGAIVPDPEGIITAGHDNKTARTVAFHRGEAINERALWRCSGRSSRTTAPAAGGPSVKPDQRRRRKDGAPARQSSRENLVSPPRIGQTARTRGRRYPGNASRLEPRRQSYPLRP